MSCKNTIMFENLIQIPMGISYTADIPRENFYMAINSDNIQITFNKFEQSNYIENICEMKPVKAKVQLYEIRVSGYLVYSISVKCLENNNLKCISQTQSTEGIITGCVCDSSILSLQSVDENNNIVPYLIIGYLASNPSDLCVEVSLEDVYIETQNEYSNSNEFILVKGLLKITTT